MNPVARGAKDNCSPAKVDTTWGFPYSTLQAKPFIRYPYIPSISVLQTGVSPHGETHLIRDPQDPLLVERPVPVAAALPAVRPAARAALPATWASNMAKIGGSHGTSSEGQQLYNWFFLIPIWKVLSNDLEYHGLILVEYYINK